MGDPIRGLYQGALVGLAVGEATASEGAPGGLGATARSVENLAESLLAVGGFDAREWREREPEDERMRVAPLARTAPAGMFFLHDAARGMAVAAEIARAVDPSRETADACRYLTGLLIGALRGESKETLLGDLYSPVYNYWLFQRTALSPRVDAAARGDCRGKPSDQVPGGAGAADLLASALWAFEATSNFEDGLRRAVALGGASAARGAVYGQLAGAHYGVSALPRNAREILPETERLESLGERLLLETARGIRHFMSWDQAASRAERRNR